MNRPQKAEFEENFVVTTFWGTGSSGATTFALEYATQLAGHGRKSLLIDFDMLDPSLMVYLAVDEHPSGLQARLRLAEQQRLDPSVISELTVRSERIKNLYFLAGLPVQGRFESISAGATSSLLRGLEDWFDELVIDLGQIIPEVINPRIFSLQREVLSESKYVYGVFRADPEGIAKLFWLPLSECLVANQYRPGSLGSGGKKAMKSVVAEVSGSLVVDIAEEDDHLVRATAKAVSVGEISRKSPINQAVVRLIQNRADSPE